MLLWDLWKACQTQWRDSTQGRSGLDYAGTEIVMRLRFALTGKERREVFCYLQIMEIAALNAWASQ